MNSRYGTVIVGSSIGGLTTAESLREHGYEDPITVIGEEPDHPYLRPALSKQILSGLWTADDASIVSAERLDALQIDLVKGEGATGLDTERHLIRTTRTEGRFENLVVATGARARLPIQFGAAAGVHTLRTMADAMVLLPQLSAARRVLVVGAGVLGNEIAAGLVKRGLEVTLAGRNPQIRFGTTGTSLSSLFVALHAAHGVRLTLGTHVTRLLSDSRGIVGATLSDGTTIPTDLVVVAAGSLPNADWLKDSGLRVADGIVCDASGQAAHAVHAVGDVARWVSDDRSRGIRIEHQQNAIEQAHAVAETLATGRPVSPAIVPFFWSELYGTRIQVYGSCDGAHRLEIVAGDDASGRFVAAATRAGVAIGIVGWNMPREFRHARALLGQELQHITERRLAS